VVRGVDAEAAPVVVESPPFSPASSLGEAFSDAEDAPAPAESVSSACPPALEFGTTTTTTAVVVVVVAVFNVVVTGSGSSSTVVVTSTPEVKQGM
jgi:hypothetical protein